MSTAYTNFIQTSVANTYVNYEGTALGNVNTLTFTGSDVLAVNLGDQVVIGVYPTQFNTSTNIDVVFQAPPVDITGNYNVPVYLDGTTVDPNYFYPYYQNTSTTANGYLANSTASYAPDNASVLFMTNGTDNWYRFIEVTNGTSWGGNIVLSYGSGSHFVANANTTIQVVPYIRFTAAPTSYYAATTLIATCELIANRPFSLYLEAAYATLSAPAVAAGGLLIRNCVGNTRVNVDFGTLNLTYSPI